MYIINNIIESERILSEPDLTKFASVVVTTNVAEIDDNYAIESDNDGDETQKNYDDNEESEVELDQADVEQNDFNIDDVDIEMDEEENVNGNPMDF